jgi:transmembrane sensor
MSTKTELDWDLIQKMLDETANPQESARWKELTSENPSYAALLPWLKNVRAGQQDLHSPYYAMDAWQDFKKRLPAQQIPLQKEKTGKVFNLLRYWSAAAAIALLIGLCWWLYPSSNKREALALRTMYAVPNGERKLITLPDSSKIWMNAGSSIQVPAEWGRDSIREVWLDGEGFFEVTKNPARPFIVHAASTDIRVLGTSFNIEAYQPSPVAVTVATGKVRFSANNGGAVTLTPDQRAVFTAADTSFHTTLTDASLYNGWRQGVLQFNDEPLEKVIATLERTFAVRLKMVGEFSTGQYCTARFNRDESLDNILQSLQHIYGLKITHQDGHILIQSKLKRK